MSVQKLKKSPKDLAAAKGSVSATVKKAFKTNSNWEDKDEFLDVIYWFRQVLAILLGIIWGILPLKGILAIGLFALINAGVLYIYFTNFQKIDEEDYGGPWELTKEGFMTSFALFMKESDMYMHLCRGENPVFNTVILTILFSWLLLASRLYMRLGQEKKN